MRDRDVAAERAPLPGHPRAGRRRRGVAARGARRDRRPASSRRRRPPRPGRARARPGADASPARASAPALRRRAAARAAPTRCGGEDGASRSRGRRRARPSPRSGASPTAVDETPARALYRGPAEVVGARRRPGPMLGITAPGRRGGWAARARRSAPTGARRRWSTGVRLPLSRPTGPDVPRRTPAGDDVRAVHRMLLRIAAIARRRARRADRCRRLDPTPRPRAHRAALQDALGQRRAAARSRTARSCTRGRASPAPAPEVVRAVPADGALAGQLAAMARDARRMDRRLRPPAARRRRRDRPTPATRGAGLPTRYVAGRRAASALDGQDTLARDADDRPVNVRRLLDLLRRAALRARAQRPSSSPTARCCGGRCTATSKACSRTLHQRGAFGPARAADAYRVDVFPGDAARRRRALHLRAARRAVAAAALPHLPPRARGRRRVDRGA